MPPYRPTAASQAHFKAILGYVQGFYELVGHWGTPLVGVFLYALGCADRDPTVSELAQLAAVDLKTASYVVGVLRKRSLVELVVDPRDTRKKRVRLTVKGGRLVHMIHRALVNVCREIVGTT